jgi:hypothetical protein
VKALGVGMAREFDTIRTDWYSANEFTAPADGVRGMIWSEGARVFAVACVSSDAPTLVHSTVEAADVSDEPNPFP